MLMVRIPPPPLPFTDRVSTSEKNSLVFCLIYRLLLSKIQGFYKYIIAESCCSISLIFDFLEKGPIFHFWTAYAVLAQKLVAPFPKFPYMRLKQTS